MTFNIDKIPGKHKFVTMLYSLVFMLRETTFPWPSSKQNICMLAHLTGQPLPDIPSVLPQRD
jgi:hypothetical protein